MQATGVFVVKTPVAHGPDSPETVDIRWVVVVAGAGEVSGAANAERPGPDNRGLLYGRWNDKLLADHEVNLSRRLSALSIDIRASAPV